MDMENDLQELFCQAGDHTWTRPVKRGRKPPSCPEHMAVVPQPQKSQTKSLTCAEGHTWEHQGRGTPKWCPDHRPAPVSIREVVCAFDGHTWIRPQSKGKAPKFCPEHQPVKEEPEVKIPKPPYTINVNDPVVIAIMSGPISELQRKMRYIIEQFANYEESERAEVDWRLLKDTFRLLIIEGQKTLPAFTTPERNNLNE